MAKREAKPAKMSWVVPYLMVADSGAADQFWGDRMLRLTDKDGHQWSFATNIADHA